MPIRGFAKGASSRHPGFQSTPPLIALGGLNEDENPQSLKQTDLKIASNTARKGNMTGTRPGVVYGDSDYTAAITSAAAVQGIHEYIRSVGSGNRDLVSVAGGQVYKTHNGTALDKSATTITSGAANRWTFASFQDSMFAAGGADADGFWYWDGTGAGSGVLGEVALSFDVKFVFSKWNMLFVGGMDGSTFDDNPMVARYCDYATDATDEANWKQSNVIPGQLLGENFGIGSYGSEYMTGFASYTDNRGDFLLFLTNKRIVTFQPNPTLTSNADAFRITDTIATGCVTQDAFVSLGLDVGDSVYLSEDGIHSLAQSQQYGNRDSQYLSWPIRKTFDTLNRSRLKFASGAYWPTEGMVLFSVSTGSNSVNDLILCLDIKGAERLTPETVRWYKWELNGMDANLIVPMRGSDGNPYPYVAGTAGEVVRFNRDTYSDLSTNVINCRFQTKDEDFGLPSREKHVGDAFVSLQGNGSYTVQHSIMLDDGSRLGQTSLLEVPTGGDVWGTGKWGKAKWSSDDGIKRQRIPGVGSSVTIGHRFQHSGANEPFWVGLISQEVMISGPTDDAEANTVGSSS